jgi:hypothetical protein
MAFEQFWVETADRSIALLACCQDKSQPTIGILRIKSSRSFRSPFRHRQRLPLAQVASSFARTSPVTALEPLRRRCRGAARTASRIADLRAGEENRFPANDGPEHFSFHLAKRNRQNNRRINSDHRGKPLSS